MIEPWVEVTAYQDDRSELELWTTGPVCHCVFGEGDVHAPVLCVYSGAPILPPVTSHVEQKVLLRKIYHSEAALMFVLGREV